MRRLVKAWPIWIALLGAAYPAGAQTIEELEQQIAASEKPADALALARSQAGAGNLLEALGTLERLLTAQPNDKQARLLHADLLCRIDDQTGAALDFARIKKSSYAKADWDAAHAACVAPPKPPQDNREWQRRRRPGF